MKQNTTYIALAVTAVLAAGCRQEKMQEEDSIRYREISVTLDSPAMKSTVDPSSDDIYLYAFNGSGENTVIAAPAEKDGGIYTYSIPEDTESAVFSNIPGGHEVFKIRSAENGHVTFYMSDEYFTTNDFVAGACSVSTDSDAPVSVHLTRLCAKLTADLKIKDNNGEYLDAESIISIAAVSTWTRYSDVQVGTDGSISYSGEYPDAWFGTPGRTPDEPLTYNICHDVSLLPGIEGANTTLGLQVKTVHDEIFNLEKELGYRMEPNRHYYLTITLNYKPMSGFGFEIEDIVTEEINVNL